MAETLSAEQRAETALDSVIVGRKGARDCIAAAIRAAEQAARRAALEEAAAQCDSGECAKAILRLAQKEDGRGE